MPGVLKVGLLSPVHTLNPRESRELVSTLATHQVFETPYEPPRAGEAAPAVLADGPLRPEQSGPGQHVYSAGVRPGVTFSDGTPLTAAHLATSLSRVEDIREQCTVEARGDRVFFTLSAPNPRWDLALTLPRCGVVLEKGGQLLGTGPFVLAPGSPVAAPRLLKNPRFRSPVDADEVQFAVYPPTPEGKPEALLEALARGEVDLTNMLSRGDAADATGVRKIFQPSNSTATLFFNTQRPALAERENRRGLVLALHRRALTELSYANALAFTATSLLPPMMGASQDGLDHDLDKARALLKGGVAGPLRLLRVWAPRPYLPNPQPVADLIAQQLAVVGVKVEVLVPRSAEEFFRSGQRGDYDMVLGGWIADTPDPADFLEAHLRSDRIPGTVAASVAGVNYARFKNGDMDTALKRFRADPTPEHRAAILALVALEAPFVPLMHGPTVLVSTWRVKNVEVTPLGALNLGRITMD